MYHPLTRHLIHILLVPRRTVPPQPLPKLHEDEESSTLSHTRKSSNEEGILQPHVRHPRSNAVADSKAHGVAHKDDRHHCLSGKVLVAVDAVGDGELETDRVRESDHTHCKYAAEPLDVVCGTFA